MFKVSHSKWFPDFLSGIGHDYLECAEKTLTNGLLEEAKDQIASFCYATVQLIFSNRTDHSELTPDPFNLGLVNLRMWTHWKEADYYVARLVQDYASHVGIMKVKMSAAAAFWELDFYEISADKTDQSGTDASNDQSPAQRFRLDEGYDKRPDLNNFVRRFEGAQNVVVRIKMKRVPNRYSPAMAMHYILRPEAIENHLKLLHSNVCIVFYDTSNTGRDKIAQHYATLLQEDGYVCLYFCYSNLFSV